MADVAKLLESVINLIDKDVKEISKLSGEGKLPHLVSQDLVRYSGALLSLQQSLEETAGKAKRKLSELSTEELKALAREAMDE